MENNPKTNQDYWKTYSKHHAPRVATALDKSDYAFLKAEARKREEKIGRVATDLLAERLCQLRQKQEQGSNEPPAEPFLTEETDQTELIIFEPGSAPGKKKVTVSCSTQEYRCFSEWAKYYNLSIPKGMKYMALAYAQSAYIVPDELQQQYTAIRYELNRQGNNMNQIAHNLNAAVLEHGIGSISPEEVRGKLQEIKSMMQQLETFISSLLPGGK